MLPQSTPLICGTCGSETPRLMKGMCSHCFYAARYQSNREKVLEKRKAYQAAHRAQILQRKRQHYHEQRERLLEEKRTYYREHHEEALTRLRAYNAANQERRRAWTIAHAARQRAAARRSHWKHHEKRLASGAAYRQSHREAERERMHRRRAAAQSNPRIDCDAVYDRDGGLCHICGKPVDRKRMSLDHVVPIARGGQHVFTNVRASHRSCNFGRSAYGAGQPYLL